MKNSSAFSSLYKFYDEKHFPYGISRSGEFSRQQVQLLERHGNAYFALASGQREAVDDEERDFVRVCHGEKEPTTEHEVTWHRYCSKIKQMGFPFLSLYLPTSMASGSDVFDVDD